MSEKKFVRKVSQPERRADLKVDLQSKYLAPGRKCSATSKATGERCGRWASLGMAVCVVHGGATRRAKTAAAKRIAQASGYAADMLVEFMADPKIDVKLRSSIAQDLLTRAGVNGKQEVEVMVGQMPKWEADLQELFVVYPDGPATPTKNEVVEDAVIVPDEQAAIEAAHDAFSEQLERQRTLRKKQGYSGAPVAPPTVKARAVVRNQPPRQTRDVSGPDIEGPYGS
ncbi:hypothetical protein [Glaciihabitans sp. UYNi722]|uniref:hypothetical protein n=1 Tax=Glaciihabitans sp. UYNi722 TaxID=3156344 RepID=UPI0033945E45